MKRQSLSRSLVPGLVLVGLVVVSLWLVWSALSVPDLAVTSLRLAGAVGIGLCFLFLGIAAVKGSELGLLLSLATGTGGAALYTLEAGWFISAIWFGLSGLLVFRALYGLKRHTKRDRVSAAHQNPRASTPSQPFPLEGKGSGV